MYRECLFILSNPQKKWGCIFYGKQWKCIFLFEKNNSVVYTTFNFFLFAFKLLTRTFFVRVREKRDLYIKKSMCFRFVAIFIIQSIFIMRAYMSRIQRIITITQGFSVRIIGRLYKVI